MAASKLLRKMETRFLIKVQVPLELECTWFLHFLYRYFMQMFLIDQVLELFFCREAGYSYLLYSFLVFLIFLNIFGKKPKSPIRVILLL